MLEAAAQAWIVFDPREREDAMHAALYRARQSQTDYLRRLLKRLESGGRLSLAARLCRGELKTHKLPCFAKALDRIEAELSKKS